eukprot:2508776-Amphidinium_carterae.1
MGFLDKRRTKKRGCRIWRHEGAVGMPPESFACEKCALPAACPSDTAILQLTSPMDFLGLIQERVSLQSCVRVLVSPIFQGVFQGDEVARGHCLIQ